MEPPPLSPCLNPTDRRNVVTLKLLFIAGFVLLLQWPLHLVNGLRHEDFALLAGTAALFAALAAVMYFTRHIDWHAQDARMNPLPGAGAEGAR